MSLMKRFESFVSNFQSLFLHLSFLFEPGQEMAEHSFILITTFIHTVNPNRREKKQKKTGCVMM